MQLKKLMVCGAVGVVALFGNPVLAQDFEMPDLVTVAPDDMGNVVYVADLPPPGGPPHGFFDELGLTDDQLEKLADLKIHYKVSVAQKQADLKLKFHQLMDLLSQSTVDKQRVMSLQSEINAMHDDLSNSRAAYMVDSSSVFTADQKNLLHHKMLMHMFMDGGGPGGCMMMGHGGHAVPVERHHMEWHHHHE